MLTLFANAMVIGQLCGNLLGVMSHWVGLENVFMFLPYLFYWDDFNIVH